MIEIQQETNDSDSNQSIPSLKDFFDQTNTNEWTKILNDKFIACLSDIEQKIQECEKQESCLKSKNRRLMYVNIATTSLVSIVSTRADTHLQYALMGLSYIATTTSLVQNFVRWSQKAEALGKCKNMYIDLKNDIEKQLFLNPADRMLPYVLYERINGETSKIRLLLP